METGYKIERAPDVSGSPGTFAQIATVGANVKTYANTGLTANTNYYYRVRAIQCRGQFCVFKHSQCQDTDTAAS